MTEHPRPDTPESKVEHQADQPGVTTGGESQGKAGSDQQDANQDRKAGASAFKGGQSERAYHGTGQLGEQKVDEQPNAGSRD
jgi:hypothetical protein